MLLIFLKWVLVLQIIGIIGFPISYFLFKHVKGIGIGFSKPLGILFLCSTYWIISNIPYVSHGNSSLFIWAFFLLSFSCPISKKGAISKIANRIFFIYISLSRNYNQKGIFL